MLTQSPPTSATQSAPALDKVEQQILAALRVDGRRSWRDIARQINTSESTVARRVRALMEAEVFRTTIAVDPQRCGFGYPVVLKLTCDFGKASEVASALSARPDIRFVVHIAGEFDILAELIVTSSKHLAEVLIEEIPRIAGIHQVATNTILRRFLPQQDWTGLYTSSWAGQLSAGQS